MGTIVSGLGVMRGIIDSKRRRGAEHSKTVLDGVRGIPGEPWAGGTDRD